MKVIADVLVLAGYVVLGIAGAIALALVLRVVISWATSNPFAWLPYHLRRLTEPLVMPLRSPFGHRQPRYDLLPLISAIIVFGIGSFISYVLFQSAELLWSFYQTVFIGLVNARFMAWWLIRLLGLLLQIAVFLRFFLPWFGFGYSSAFMRFLFKLTEPLLRPIRRLLGQYLVKGSFDFTPLLALFLIQFLTPIIADLVR